MLIKGNCINSDMRDFWRQFVCLCMNYRMSCSIFEGCKMSCGIFEGCRMSFSVFQ